MSRDPSRWLAIYFYSAVLARQLGDDGEIRCAYCRTPLAVSDQVEGGFVFDAEDPYALPDLIRAGRCLDHVNGNDTDNREENLVAACCTCNKAAGRHDSRGNQRLEERLTSMGIKPYVAARAVRKILDTPTPERSSPVVVQVAEEWFGPRLQYQRDIAAKRAGREPTREPRPRRARNTDLPF